MKISPISSFSLSLSLSIYLFLFLSLSFSFHLSTELFFSCLDVLSVDFDFFWLIFPVPSLHHMLFLFLMIIMIIIDYHYFISKLFLLFPLYINVASHSIIIHESIQHFPV